VDTSAAANTASADGDVGHEDDDDDDESSRKHGEREWYEDEDDSNDHGYRERDGIPPPPPPPPPSPPPQPPRRGSVKSEQPEHIKVQATGKGKSPNFGGGPSPRSAGAHQEPGDRRTAPTFSASPALPEGGRERARERERTAEGGSPPFQKKEIKDSPSPARQSPPTSLPPKGTGPRHTGDNN
jgi:hypothetical protein